MDIASAIEDFEKFKLTTEHRDDCTLQLVRDSSTGVDSWQSWKRKRHLGEGFFGEVWQEAWEDKHGDWHYRAVKACSERKMRAAQIDYKRELSALAAFSRSECAGLFVNLHGWWLASGKIFVAMEYLGRGDLSSYASNGISETEIKEIADNVLRGLAVMHKEGFTHRDIKPKNILVYQKRPEHRRWWVKIADFGISKQVLHDAGTALHTSVGTRAYCAPEVLGHLEQYQDISIYDNKVDMWSFGCVLFNLGSRGQLPFSDRDLMKYCDGTVGFNPKKVPIYLNEDGKRLLKALLQAEPSQRPAAVEALHDPWLMSTMTTTAVTTTTPSNSNARSISEPQMNSPQNFNSFLNTTLSTSPAMNSITVPPGKHPATSTVVTEATRCQPVYEDTSIHSSDRAHNEKKSPYIAELNPTDSTELKDTSGLDRHDNDDDNANANANVTAVKVDQGEHNKPTSSGSQSRDEIYNSQSNNNQELVQDERQDVDVEMTTWLEANEGKLANGKTLLHVAAKQGELSIMKKLARQQADIDAKDNIGWTPLRYVVYNGQLEAAQWLVDKGADIDAKSDIGWTPLHYVAWNGKLEAAQWLVDKGADIDAKSNNGWTPLHYAVRNGQLHIAQWLVEKGANIHAKDDNGWTPLHIAVRNGQLQVAQWLVEKGANIHAKDDNGWTPLHIAARNGHLHIAHWLVEKGADIDARDRDGRTPLHGAAWTSQLQVAQWLVERGADISTKDIEGRTPRNLAEKYYHRQLAQWLKEQEVAAKAKREPESSSPLPRRSPTKEEPKSNSRTKSRWK